MFFLPNNDWKDFFLVEKQKSYFINLEKKLNILYKQKIIFPEYENIFGCFNKTDLTNLKVIILGQDPYHNGNATGCAFACKNKISKSLENIKKELIYENSNLDFDLDISLNKWSAQGVLLLNTILTVEKAKPLSHKDIGWEIFLINLFLYLQKFKNDIVVLILGKSLDMRNLKITNPTWKIFQTSHPSFFSFKKGFYKSDIFKKINTYLNLNCKYTINWWA